MKRLIKTTIAAAATFIVAAAFTAPAIAADNIRIIVVSHGQANDPFWSVVKNGVVAAGKETGVSVEYRAPETFDMVAMSQLIDAAVNQNPAGLVVSIPDASALGPSIKKAVAAGIPVISMNSGSDVSKSLGALLHVGQDEETAGKAAGEKLKEMGGKVALCVNQEVGNVALDLRCKGFSEGFGGKVTVLPVSNEPAEVRAKVKASLQANGDVDTILALGAGTAGEPSLAAVKDFGETRESQCRDLRSLARFSEGGRRRRSRVRNRPATVLARLPAGRVSRQLREVRTHSRRQRCFGPQSDNQRQGGSGRQTVGRGNSLSGAFARGEFILPGGVVASVASPTA